MKEKILEILKDNKNYLSGTIIAEKLNISRMAVSKNIKKLIEDGHEIEAIRNRGYLLVNEKDTIDVNYIRNSISNFYSDVIFFDEINSTNDYLKLHSNNDSGYVVIADSQSAGRGRYTRSFHSPKNKGIYLSLLLKPENLEFNPVKITSMTAVAVNEAIKKIYPVDSKIKWVNDIIINNKKICGILIEASMEMNTASLEYLVIGIGINVFKHNFPEEIKDIASSIENECDYRVSRNKLIIEVLSNLELMLKDPINSDYLSKYISDSAVINKKVFYNYNKQSGIATVTNIDQNANLHLLTEDNNELIMGSGEIKLI